LTRTRRILTALLSTVGLALAACSQEAAVDDPRGDLDRLRSLPYIGSSTIAKDEGPGVVLFDEERSQPGLTLYTVQMGSLAELIDAAGEVRRSWHDPQGAQWARAELLPNGDLLVVGAEGQGPPTDAMPDEARYLMRFDWDGNVLWKRKLHVHHDVELTPSGQLLALTFKRKRLPQLHPEHDIRDDYLTLLNQDGGVLEERSLLAAFQARPDVLTLKAAGWNRLGVKPWVDLFHANSIEWMRRPELASRHPLFERDNVLVSFRHQNAVAVLDWTDRQLIWAWGRGELLGPHDAQVLDNGNLLIFDNGLGRGWSRVIEVDPLRRKIVWQFRADPAESFYTGSKGSAQRLANGNTLIADSDRGRAFEVTRDGDVVWDFFTPHETEPGQRAAIVRAVRHDAAKIAAIEAR